VLALRFVAAPAGRGRLALAFAVPLLAFGILFQEYALSVVLVVLVLLLSPLRPGAGVEGARRARQAMAVLAVVAAGAYAVYVMVADDEARTDVQPTQPLMLGLSHFVRLPFALVTAAWRGVGGGVARELANIDWLSVPNLAATGYGLLVAALLVYGCRTRPRPPAPAWSHGAWLLAALLVGLVPALAVGRIPWHAADGMASRFGLPVVPVAAALLVLAALRLVRPRFWVVPVAVLGLLAGHTALSHAWEAVRERAAFTALGQALRPHVVPGGGYTVAVVPVTDRPLGPPRQWELVARLAATWPPELSERLWAYRYGGGPPLHYREEAGRVFGERGSCTPPDALDVDVRGLTRKGPVARLLWVAPGADGSVIVEAYCLRGPPEAR
jgi:hypothetical protein